MMAECNNDFCEIIPKARNLDGCYFTIERDGENVNLCFSDMTETERGKVMAGKGTPWLMALAEHLADRLHYIGDIYDIEGSTE